MYLRHITLPLLFLVLVVSLSASAVAPARAQSGFWSKYSGNPVLTPSTGTWDADAVTQPRLMFDGQTYKMWYVGSGQGVVGVGYAVSPDGVTWTKYDGPVLKPGAPNEWDGAFVGLGSVLQNGTKYLMYYRGGGLTTYQNGAIGLAYSNDGVTWVKYKNNPVIKPSYSDQRFLADPYVLKETQIYNMWYAARSLADDPNSQVIRIGYATSFDGVNWVRYALPALQPSTDTSAFDSGSVFSPSVTYDGTTYGMWYTALDHGFLTPRIGYATSKDAAVWTRSQDTPALIPVAPGSWDSNGVENQDVVLARGKYLMYYDGFTQNQPPSIGLAEAPSGFQIPEFSGNVLPALAIVLLAAAVFLSRRDPAVKARV